MPATAPSSRSRVLAARRTQLVLLALWCGLIARMTLWPSLGDEKPFALLQSVLGWAQRTGVPLTFDAVEAFANVVLFLPFGALLVLVWRPRRPWWVVAVGCATSSTIELTQLVLLPHRVATVQDVVLNTAGTTVGVWLGRWLRRRATTAHRYR